MAIMPLSCHFRFANSNHGCDSPRVILIFCQAFAGEVIIVIHLQEISEIERLNFLALRERLDHSEHLWRKHDCILYPDYRELCQMILHPESKVAID